MTNSSVYWKLMPPKIAEEQLPIPLDSIKGNSYFIILGSDNKMENRQANRILSKYLMSCSSQYKNICNSEKKHYIKQILSGLLETGYKFFIQDAKEKGICYDVSDFEDSLLKAIGSRIKKSYYLGQSHQKKECFKAGFKNQIT